MRAPHIVYLLADDWGFGDVSCLNPESKIPTRHTDQLAAGGMIFTDAHSNSAVCTPTRYGVLTGRYAWRGHLKKGVLGGYDSLLIEPGRPTVASFLQEQGYRTACIGKWHLGLGWAVEGGSPEGFKKYTWAEPPTVDFSKELTTGPHSVGFDYSFIIPSSLDIPPYCYIENGRVVEQPDYEVPENPRPAYWRSGPCARGLQHETCLLEFTMKAEQFVADHVREAPDRPMFLYFPMPSPHTPHQPRAPFRGMSDCGTYGDYVVEHDWSIGRVLNSLERAGVADNTLVIVTSDNGAHMRGCYGATGFDFLRDFGHRSNYIFRGQKSDAWDGGHRVPFIARWPGVIPAGSTCDRTICLTDLFATVASINGAQVPAGAAEDSVDISPYFRSEGADDLRKETIHHGVDGRFAIRQGKWKLVEGPGSGGWSLPDNHVPSDRPAMQLYDISVDPGEENNLFVQNPDVVRELQDRLDLIRQDQD